LYVFVHFLIVEGVNAFLQMLLEVAPTAAAFDWFHFERSTYSSPKCRIIPLWHCVNCMHTWIYPILNTCRQEHYILYYKGSRLAQKIKPYKKGIYII